MSCSVHPEKWISINFFRVSFPFSLSLAIQTPFDLLSSLWCFLSYQTTTCIWKSSSFGMQCFIMIKSDQTIWSSKIWAQFNQLILLLQSCWIFLTLAVWLSVFSIALVTSFSNCISTASCMLCFSERREERIKALEATQQDKVITTSVINLFHL